VLYFMSCLHILTIESLLDETVCSILMIDVTMKEIML